MRGLGSVFYCITVAINSKEETMKSRITIAIMVFAISLLAIAFQAYAKSNTINESNHIPLHAGDVDQLSPDIPFFPKTATAQLILAGNYGECAGYCAEEQGICISNCNGNGQCIGQCAAAYGRCISRCN